MDDPYEEERRARFDAPVDVLVQALDMVRNQLLQIKDIRGSEQCKEIFDDSMDLLYSAMRLCRPLAIVESLDGRVAFRWYVVRDQVPTYYWVVCGDTGTYQFGTAQTQDDCENAARRVLAAS